MSVAKVIEITSGSDKSFEHAVRSGIKRASKTIDDISSAWVSEEKVIVKDGEVTEFRVTMRVTFMLSDKD
jgi:flavin-binding protein dodecin